MISDEDKRRIAAEEAYRASVRKNIDRGLRESPVRSGFAHEAGSALFRIIGLFAVLAIGIASCVFIR